MRVFFQNKRFFPHIWGLLISPFQAMVSNSTWKLLGVFIEVFHCFFSEWFKLFLLNVKRSLIHLHPELAWVSPWAWVVSPCFTLRCQGRPVPGATGPVEGCSCIQWQPLNGISIRVSQGGMWQMDRHTCRYTNLYIFTATRLYLRTNICRCPIIH